MDVKCLAYSNQSMHFIITDTLLWKLFQKQIKYVKNGERETSKGFAAITLVSKTNSRDTKETHSW